MESIKDAEEMQKPFMEKKHGGIDSPMSSENRGVRGRKGPPWVARHVGTQHLALRTTKRAFLTIDRHWISLRYHGSS